MVRSVPWTGRACAALTVSNPSPVMNARTAITSFFDIDIAFRVVLSATCVGTNDDRYCFDDRRVLSTYKMTHSHRNGDASEQDAGVEQAFRVECLLDGGGHRHDIGDPPDRAATPS